VVPRTELAKLDGLTGGDVANDNGGIFGSFAKLGTGLGGIGDFLFGGSGTEATSETTRAFLEMTPEQREMLLRTQQQIGERTAGLQQLIDQLQREALQPVPTLPGITVPQAPTELDPLARGLLARAQQDIQAREATQARRIGQQFRGAPGQARALQRQAQAAAIQAGNVLPFEAAREMTARQLPMQQLQLAAQQAAIQRGLSQFGLGQARRQEAVGLGQTGLGAFLQQLAAQQKLAEQLGTRVAEREQEAEKQGGLLGALGSIF
jgi:hypothetical protein